MDGGAWWAIYSMESQRVRHNWVTKQTRERWALVAQTGGRGGWQRHLRSKERAEVSRRWQEGPEWGGFLRETLWLSSLPSASTSVQQIQAVLGGVFNSSGMRVGRGKAVSVPFRRSALGGSWSARFLGVHMSLGCGSLSLRGWSMFPLLLDTHSQLVPFYFYPFIYSCIIWYFSSSSKNPGLDMLEKNRTTWELWVKFYLGKMRTAAGRWHFR